LRRVAFSAVVGLLLVALIAPVASAARPAPSFVGKASAAEPGGSLHLLAKVKHAVRGKAFAASATVHFASGDVIVALNGKAVESLSDLATGLDEVGVGKEVTLTLKRGEEQREVKVAVIDLKE